jgi:LPXTG-motif cell wall-anchored protein
MTAVREKLRSEETVIGDFVADAIKAASGADIAFMNGGSVRADLPVGDITIADINTVLPFVNFILMTKMTGADVKAILEHSLSYYPETSGGFLQISGLSVTFDPAAEPGNRITSIEVGGIGGAPLDMTAEYTVATNDWIAGGGDDYHMAPALFENTLPLAHPEITSLTDAVSWYIGTDPAIPNGVGRIMQTMGSADVSGFVPETTTPQTGNTPISAAAVFIVISALGMVVARKKK